MPFATVDSQRIEYEIAGDGAPTLVFLHGNGMASAVAWGDVLPLIADIGTRLTYNRAGVGGSSKPLRPQTAVVVVHTLRSLLERLALQPPYLLVGHSSGGIYANLFARMFPSETSGVAFVESAHPGQLEAFKPYMNPLHRMLIWLSTRNKNAEPASFFEVHHEVENAGAFPAIPIVVLTGTKPGPKILNALMEPKLALQHELAALSPRSTHLISDESGHMIQQTEPTLVADAIRSAASNVGGGTAD